MKQANHFEPTGLNLPRRQVAAGWGGAATTPDQTKFGLWGNFLEPEPYGIEFAYPAEA